MLLDNELIIKRLDAHDIGKFAIKVTPFIYDKPKTFATFQTACYLVIHPNEPLPLDLEIHLRKLDIAALRKYSRRYSKACRRCPHMRLYESTVTALLELLEERIRETT